MRPLVSCSLIVPTAVAENRLNSKRCTIASLCGRSSSKGFQSPVKTSTFLEDVKKKRMVLEI